MVALKISGRGGSNSRPRPFSSARWAANGGRSFVVVGAGIGGLAAATALARQGATVTVLERAPEICEVGAGLQISPNGAAVLDALGVEPDSGTPLGTVVLGDAMSMATVQRLDLAGAGYAHPYRAYHRADLISALQAAALESGVRIMTGTDVTDVAQGKDDVTVTLADGQRLTAQALVGADGVRSTVRTRLLPGPEPAFTGHVAWRATVPIAGLVEDAAQVWMAPHRHLVIYPLRRHGVLNIVAVQKRKDWAEEGWHFADDPANLAAAFRDVAEPLRDMLGRVESCNLWGLFRHQVPDTWHNGNAVLIGDAVHPTLPFLAQGACMALEDAWLLAHLTNGDPILPRSLAGFTAERLARVRRTVAAANFNARAYHLPTPLRQPAHAMLRFGGKVMPRAALRRFDWLYRHDVTAAG